MEEYRPIFLKLQSTDEKALFPIKEQINCAKLHLQIQESNTI